MCPTKTAKAIEEIFLSTLDETTVDLEHQWKKMTNEDCYCTLLNTLNYKYESEKTRCQIERHNL